MYSNAIRHLQPTLQRAVIGAQRCASQTA